MILAVCSFVLWASYMTFNESRPMISDIPVSTHSTLTTCQAEADEYTKRVGKHGKGLTITYKCLPDTIDPRK